MTGASIYTKKSGSISIRLNESFRHEQVNYPHSCFALDLLNNTEIKENGIQELLLEFHNLNGHELEINIEGNTLSCSREVTNHAFSDAGHSMRLHNDGLVRRYSVKIKKNTIVEEDPNNNCKVYPNSDFVNYR